MGCGLRFATPADTRARTVAEVIKDQCAVLLVSDDRKTLTPAGMVDHDSEVLCQLRHALPETFRVDEMPVTRTVLEEVEPLLASVLDFERCPRAPATTTRYSAFMRGIGVHSLLIVPLRIHQRSIGQLILARFRPEASPFNEHDLDLVQSLGAQAALAIAHARLLTESRRETAERKRSTDRFRVLANASHEFSAAAYDHDQLLDVVATR